MKVIAYTGGRITKPGIYSGVPMHQTPESPGYHGDICDGPSFSSTHLRKADKESMDEVWDIHPCNPDRAEPKDKDHFILGRAAHTLLLGEAGFRETFAIRPETYPDDKGGEKPWNGNATWCKDWLKKAASEGMDVLTVAQLENIKGMARRMMGEPLIATGGILNGLVEHSLFWKDAQTGIWLKARPDVIPTDSRLIVDLKTAHAVDWESVERAIGENRYHMQAALIAEGLETLVGGEWNDAVYPFVKVTRPWSINITPIDGESLTFGRMQNRRAINRIAECLRTNNWPGPSDSEVAKGLPPWMKKRLMKEAEDGLLPDVGEAPEPTPSAATQALRDVIDDEAI